MPRTPPHPTPPHPTPPHPTPPHRAPDSEYDHDHATALPRHRQQFVGAPALPKLSPKPTAGQTLHHGAPTRTFPPFPVRAAAPPTRHSVGLLLLYGALDSHPFSPSHVASGRCVLSAAAAGTPAGVVSAFAEPSGWCAGAVLDVAGCAVCASAAPSSCPPPPPPPSPCAQA